MRWPKILTVGAAFALLNLTLAQTVASLERLEPLLLFVLGGLAIAGWAARGVRATWTETVAGFAVGLAPTIDGRATLQLSLLFCASGLFLAPIVSGPVRRDPEIDLPADKILRIAAAILATVILLVVASGLGTWKDGVVVAAFLAAESQVVVACAAMLMTFFGRTSSGAWVGSICALTFVVSFTAFVLLFGNEIGGRDAPSADSLRAMVASTSAPIAWRR